jgi:predicted Zn finger-like uncharacterized protein
MSLITSCPTCGTMFRVVPDQLKISEGWVRCGHCNEVFDATSHLSDESVLVEPELAQQATRPDDAPADAAADAAELATRPADMATRPAELSSRPAELPQRPEAPPRPKPAAGESSDPSDFFGEDSHVPLEPSPLDAPFVFRPSEVSLNLRDSELPEPGGESQVLPPGYDEFDEPEDEELQDVSFVRNARREAFWHRPGVRIALACGSFGLALLLLLQIVHQDRDRLALAQPALRPLLEGLCGLTGCTLGAPRQIEAIVIESSGFNRLRNDTYRLSFTLRNTAPVAVAAPAMELTITDAQDQAIARRVLTLSDLGSEPATIAAASEWSRTVGIELGTTGSARVAGYRLLAFYP